MQATELSRLNRVLADAFGLNAHGEPLFRWMQNKHLLIPTRKTGGIWMPGFSDFEWTMQMPQVEKDQWVLSMWLAPPPMVQWIEQFGDATPYPRNGMYYFTDVILKRGVEPNDIVTLDFIGAMRKVRSMTQRQFAEDQAAKEAKMDRENDTLVGDFIHDKMTAFGNVPGTRSGLTSFPEARPGVREHITTPTN